MKAYIYIEVKENEDLVLQGFKCKKIGELKNNKQDTYEITEGSVHLFVVFDKRIPKKFHTKYLIPEGKDDITLYTKPKLNPLKGNPFEIF